MARGKGSERKQKHCGYNRPHQPHVYSGEKEREQGKSGARKFWCPGRASASGDHHVHAWDVGQPVVNLQTNELWNGPFECVCGASKWLKDGIAGPDRFPHGDPLERIMALKDKVDTYGPDSLDEDDKAELAAIADEIVRILQPLMDQLLKIGEMIAQMIQSFLDSLSPETVAYLAELGKSIGEKPDAVDTIELRDSMTGEVIATELLTPSPIAAVPTTALLSDEDQIAAIEYVSEPVTSPVQITPTMMMPIQPGQASVGGRLIDLADIASPRAQRFGRASEL